MRKETRLGILKHLSACLRCTADPNAKCKLTKCEFWETDTMVYKGLELDMSGCNTDKLLLATADAIDAAIEVMEGRDGTN